jgi:hypothetical protein
VAGRAASLQTFADWLAAAHPEVGSLRHLTRTHLEGFLAFHARRGWRGRVARDRRISVRYHARTVVDLRAFFDDVAAWGWAERPNVLLLHRSDIPRLPQPLPRALPPDVDAALTAAVADLDDPAARCGIVLLRGTGLRLGELHPYIPVIATYHVLSSLHACRGKMRPVELGACKGVDSPYRPQVYAPGI